MSSETLLNGRYHLISQQGSGGMAVIYKAVDRALGRTVAVKILRPSLTNDPSFIVRFQNEARSIANLSHPNIVTVHDVGSDGPTHYMVMEFIEGQDLKKIIKASGALSVERALSIAIQICAGAGFAHRAGLVHADIKPQNVLMTKDDVVKLTDFGIAQALSDTQPQQRESVVWGSPHYFAPEQAKGEKPTAASDVYSIGIVMFEMLTGRLPYNGTNQQELAISHIRERIPSVTEFNPAVPEALANIVLKVMSKEPSQRYRMADQLGHVLINYRDQGRERTMGTPVPATPERGDSRQLETQPPPPGGDGAIAAAAAAGSAVRVTRDAVVPITPAPPPPQGVGVSGSQQTVRYNIAPDAPQPNPYGRQQGASSVGQPTMPAGQGAYPPMQSPTRTDSGPYDPNSYYPPRGEQSLPQVMDGVTIALAVLAFMAVACLIPLYIAVLSARLP